jgi:hypothetical protein
MQTFYSANYSTVIAVDFAPLLAYIEENLGVYVMNILLLDGNVAETDQTIVRILNSENIEAELKQRFIVHQRSSVNDLGLVRERATKQILLRKRKVVPNWHNVFEYLVDVEGNSMDDTLRSYLSDKSVSEALSKMSINSTKEVTEDEQRHMVDLVIFDPDMDYSADIHLLTPAV